jgi:urate oxidase
MFLTITFVQVSATVEAALVNTFAGPSDKGVYSKSVQQTLYQMATAALKSDGAIDSVSRCLSCAVHNSHNVNSFCIPNT